MRRRLFTLVAISLFASGGLLQAAPDAKLRNEIRSRVDVGLNWLRWRLTPAGGYGNADITPGAVRAFALSHRRYNADDGPFMRRPIEYIGRQLDGDDVPVMRRAHTVSALAVLPGAPHAETIAREVALLEAWVTDAARGTTPPDLQTVAAVANALVAARAMSGATRAELLTLAQRGTAVPGVTGSAEAMRALALARIQGDGLDAALDAARTALVQTYGWWERDRVPPPMASVLVLTQALEATGTRVVTDASGAARDWATELAQLVIARQHVDGYWEDGDRIAATVNAVSALEILFSIK